MPINIDRDLYFFGCLSGPNSSGHTLYNRHLVSYTIRDVEMPEWTRTKIDMVEIAKTYFSEIWARFKFPIRLYAPCLPSPSEREIAQLMQQVSAAQNKCDDLAEQLLNTRAFLAQALEYVGRVLDQDECLAFAERYKQFIGELQ